MRQDQKAFAALLQNPETIGTLLLVGLLDEFGTEFLGWEPETLEREISQTWNVQVPARNRDKIWALVTELTTDTFYSSLDGFIHICNALSDHGADFQNFDPATVQEMCWALAEIHLINPPDEKTRFNDEIVAYMKARLETESFQKAPQMLRPYVPDTATDAVEEPLAMDGIDYNGFWDKQQRDRLQIDEYVRNRLFALIQGLAALPLHHADAGHVQELVRNASKALAVQAQATAQASEAVAPPPTL